MQRNQEIDKDIESKQRNAEISACYQRLFNNPDGEKVINHIKRYYPAGWHINPYQHAYNRGTQDVIEFILLMASDNKYAEYLEKIANASDKKG
jgi:hypothetical protein